MSSLREIVSSLRIEDEEDHQVLKETQIPPIKPERATTEELAQWLVEASRLLIDDTRAVVDEYIWRIGGRENLFYDIFTRENVYTEDNRWITGYIFVNNQSTVIAREIARYYPRGTAEELSLRVGENRCRNLRRVLKTGNMRLIRWADHKIPVNRLSEWYSKSGRSEWNGSLIWIAVENNLPEVFEWLNDQWPKICYNVDNVLDWCCEYGRKEIVRYMRKNYGKLMKDHWI